MMVEQGMQLESLFTRLYEAALSGDLPSLLTLLREDPLILRRCSIERAGRFTKSPLHVAANLGHLEFTREILRREPELAEELDHCQRSSPLHMSAAKGHLDVVKALLEVKPEMCLAQDLDGRNPVHVAAIKGHIHVLGELLQANPHAARERTSGGESVLHLCIKHHQPEVLKFLVDTMNDDELLNFKDSDDNTVLHLAVAAKQPETISFLLKNKNMEKNAINKNGCSARDIYSKSSKDPGNSREIRRSLKRAKALRAKDVLKPINHRSWLKDQRNGLMVAASLIATMAFQVGVNPPGGVWQDDDNNKNHTAGSSIMADKNSEDYDSLLVCNTLALVSSLSVIFLLISGLPSKRVFVVILMATMAISVTATTLTYFLSINDIIRPKEDGNWVLGCGLIVWGLMMSLLILWHIGHLIVVMIARLVSLVRKLCKNQSSKPASPPCV